MDGREEMCGIFDEAVEGSEPALARSFLQIGKSAIFIGFWYLRHASHHFFQGPLLEEKEVTGIEDRSGFSFMNWTLSRQEFL